MLRFRDYIQYVYESVKDESKPSSDTKGKLHELLVGYHLNGGNHMDHHEDKAGDSPEIAHDKLKSSIKPEHYQKIFDRAKSAADDIRKSAETAGHKITKVHWTSKPGDLKKSTGIEASQTQDASDIVVHTSNGKKTKFHGISLKVTDSANKQIPVSNPGMSSTLGGELIHNKHKDSIIAAYPEIGKASNKEKRAKILSDNPKMAADIKTRNITTLRSVANNLHSKLSNMKSEDLVQHIRNHVLASNTTPMQAQGHNHIRHTTYEKRGKIEHHAIDPSSHFEHILQDHKNISVQHSGTAVHFYHTDPKTGKKTKFASHRIKFGSQSDPLSTIKGSGVAHV
jgi:Tfp pilus assembly protein FimT